MHISLVLGLLTHFGDFII